MAFLKEIVKKVFSSDEIKEPELVGLTYVWRIENYSTIPPNQSKDSQCFTVGEDSYALELSKICTLAKTTPEESIEENLNIKLIQVKPREPALKFLCDVGLVDCHGKLHHFVRKEAEMGKGSETKELLKIPSKVLAEESCIVIPNDILSVQLAINLLTENNLLTPYSSERDLKSLSCHMEKLFEDKTSCDVVFKFVDTIYKAHRLVLSARSPVFARMFLQNSKGRSKEIISIEDVESSLFSNLLYYMYTGKVRGLTPETASKMTEAADKYHLHELKNICISFLTANLMLGNICDAVLVADKFRDEQLEKAVFEFISKNVNTIILSEQWKNFKTKHTTVANSVLCNILLSGKMT